MNRMSSLGTAILMAAVCALSGCASLQVTSDVNTALVGSVQCHTYGWAGSFHGASPLRSTVANPINEQRLRAAIATQLGLRAVLPATSQPDCLVGYGIGTRNVVESAYPYGYGWGWGYPYVYSEVIVAVDLFDAHNSQPLWHAYVPLSSSELTGPKAEQDINSAVAAIFEKYPYASVPANGTAAPPPTAPPPTAPPPANPQAPPAPQPEATPLPANPPAPSTSPPTSAPAPASPPRNPVGDSPPAI